MKVSHLDCHNGLRSAIVKVSVVKCEVVGNPGLAGAVDEVVLEEAEPDGLHVINAGEDFHAVHCNETSLRAEH